MAATPALEITDLSTHIQLTKSVVQAVGQLDLAIEPGETLGLVGESGCGKSMTGLSIMGLLPPGGAIVGGSIKLDGRELVGLGDAELRADPGQRHRDDLPGSADLAGPHQDDRLPGRRAGPAAPGGEQGRGLDRWPPRCSAGRPAPAGRAARTTIPHQLSGGLRQRVMIAMALSCEPKLLIADEPTTALDVTIQAQILALLDDLKDRLGMAMLLITHDMGVIAGHADRVKVMYAGPDGRGDRDRAPVRAHAPPVHPGPAGLHPAARARTPAAAAHHRRAAAGPGRTRRPAAGSRRGAAGPRTRAARGAAAGRRGRHRSTSSPAGIRWTARPEPERGAGGGASGPGPAWPRARPRTAGRRRGPGGAPAGDARSGQGVPGHLGRHPAAQGRLRCTPCPGSRSRCRPARPSAWSASPAAARPRIGRLIVALERPNAGELLLSGEDICGLQPRRSCAAGAATCR